MYRGNDCGDSEKALKRQFGLELAKFGAHSPRGMTAVPMADSQYAHNLSLALSLRI